jgi:dihydropteroate synthase
MSSFSSESLQEQVRRIDDQLSRRSLELDPAGYFVIYVDRQQQLICAKYYSTVINERGLATDPETGAVIPARGPVNRSPQRVYVGRTAKELCVQIFEKESEKVVSQLSHAAYLGREFQKAEAALLSGEEYVQD